jgi:hypothetical protein
MKAQGRVMNYDPNFVLSGRMAQQRVRLTFGTWEFRKTVETVVGGNCRGMTVIDCAIEDVYERLDTDNWGAKEIVLVKEDGDELTCPDEEYDGYEFLKNMLIAAEIVSIEPEEAGK